MEFKYNDKVVIVDDPENDGFYLGLDGVVINYACPQKKHPTSSKNDIVESYEKSLFDKNNQGELVYEIYIRKVQGWGETIYAKPHQIKKMG